MSRLHLYIGDDNLYIELLIHQIIVPVIYIYIYIPRQKAKLSIGERASGHENPLKVKQVDER